MNPKPSAEALKIAQVSAALELCGWWPAKPASHDPQSRVAASLYEVSDDGPEPGADDGQREREESSVERGPAGRARGRCGRRGARGVAVGLRVIA